MRPLIRHVITVRERVTRYFAESASTDPSSHKIIAHLDSNVKTLIRVSGRAETRMFSASNADVWADQIASLEFGYELVMAYFPEPGTPKLEVQKWMAELDTTQVVDLTEEVSHSIAWTDELYGLYV
jgi:hypothetical protein